MVQHAKYMHSELWSSSWELSQVMLVEDVNDHCAVEEMLAKKGKLGNKWYIRILMHCINVFMSSALLTQVKMYYSLLLHVSCWGTPPGGQAWTYIWFPGYSLCYKMGVDNDGLPYYRCICGTTQLRVVFTCQSITHLDLCEHLLSSQMPCYAVGCFNHTGKCLSTRLKTGLVMRLLNLLQRLVLPLHSQFLTFWQLTLWQWDIGILPFQTHWSTILEWNPCPLQSLKLLH